MAGIDAAHTVVAQSRNTWRTICTAPLLNLDPTLNDS
jgi:hypothetical protein